jgi:hypothetical protein
MRRAGVVRRSVQSLWQKKYDENSRKIIPRFFKNMNSHVVDLRSVNEYLYMQLSGSECGARSSSS